MVLVGIFINMEYKKKSKDIDISRKDATKLIHSTYI